MKNNEFDVEGKTVKGLEVPLPAAPLVLAYGKSGFVMCGYLNVPVAEKLGVAAAMVRGVSNIDDLLKAPIQAMTPEAEKKGVKIGMNGREALAVLV